MTIFVYLLCSAIISQVKGHGRLVEPPSRATAWRYGFNTPKNYNDHELYCGGWSRQHQRNAGKCGVCGDPFDLPTPRPHEGGGVYSTGTIVRSYQEGSTMEVGVELTANHHGFFEFRLCPQNNDKKPENQDCFDKNLLQRADGQGHRYFPGPGSGIVFRAKYLLPADLTCNQCVLQWRYVAGNNWGTCENGTGSVGCGPQEEFRACADVRITSTDNTTTSTTPVVSVVSVVSSSTTTTTAATTVRSTPRFPFRTRGTSTTRVTKPATTTTTTATTATAEASTTTTTVPTTASSTSTVFTTSEESTTSSTTTTTTDATRTSFPYDATPSPGPYIGIIIALASLLFAILFILAIIVYFYQGHESIKKLIQKHRPMKKSEKSRKSLQLPSSILGNFYPNLTGNPDKKPLPKDIDRQPRPISVRQLSIIISEPIDVTINGVPVLRNNSPTEDSTA